MKIPSSAPPLSPPPTNLHKTPQHKAPATLEDKRPEKRPPQPPPQPVGPSLSEILQERAATGKQAPLRSEPGAAALPGQLQGKLPAEGGALFLSRAAPLRGGGPTNPAGNAPQHWQNSCGAHVMMTMEAAVDPNQAAYYQGLSGDERHEVEAAVFTSSSNFAERHLYERKPGSSTEGWGPTEMANQIKDRFGSVEEKRPGTQDEATEMLIEAVEGGSPVAIGLNDHWISATDVRDSAEGKEILIHDPWTGKSAWVPEADLREGGDWPQEHFGDEAYFSGHINSLLYPTPPPSISDQSQYHQPPPSSSNSAAESSTPSSPPAGGIPPLP